MAGQRYSTATARPEYGHAGHRHRGIRGKADPGDIPESRRMAQRFLTATKVIPAGEATPTSPLRPGVPSPDLVARASLAPVRQPPWRRLNQPPEIMPERAICRTFHTGSRPVNFVHRAVTALAIASGFRMHINTYPAKIARGIVSLGQRFACFKRGAVRSGRNPSSDAIWKTGCLQSARHTQELDDLRHSPTRAQ